MKCPYCGFDNSERSSFCNSCGKEMSSPVGGTGGWSRRGCVACGRTIPDVANVCPYCGHDYRSQSAMPSAAIGTGLRILFYVLSFIIPIAGFIIGAIYYAKPDRESKHVGKICLVLAIAAILLFVGLAAVMYIMVLGFSSGPPPFPVCTLAKSPVPNGVRFTFVSITQEPTWSDITIMLNDGSNLVDWSPSMTHLSEDPGALEQFVPVAFGSMLVFCNVTDLGGNGLINGGDYFTLTTSSAITFSPSTTYTVTIVYEPTAEAIGRLHFTG